MVDNGYSMYEDILNFPKKVVELGGGEAGRRMWYFIPMLTYDRALSLRIEEEKECLIYIYFFPQATFHPLFKYITRVSKR